ncbi:MAG: hypothetical protein CM15mV29_0930 [uncultured marine virus]|nr:MAG: hypothetical protein CM15mV29_0930 [uncultured marine virus]
MIQKKSEDSDSSEGDSEPASEPKPMMQWSPKPRAKGNREWTDGKRRRRGRRFGKTWVVENGERVPLLGKGFFGFFWTSGFFPVSSWFFPPVFSSGLAFYSPFSIPKGNLFIGGGVPSYSIIYTKLLYGGSPWDSLGAAPQDGASGKPQGDTEVKQGV